MALRWVYSPSIVNENFDGGCPGFCDEGIVYDCIDGCCVDPEFGCDLCATRCDYCWTREPIGEGADLSADPPESPSDERRDTPALRG